MNTEITNYEILIRFQRDGSVAAHEQKLLTVHNGNEIVSETVLTPENISLQQLQDLVASL
jgi:hypothetical protein